MAAQDRAIDIRKASHFMHRQATSLPNFIATLTSYWLIVYIMALFDNVQHLQLLNLIFYM